MNDTILDAIRNKEIITFEYEDGKERMVLVFCYGLVGKDVQIHGMKFHTPPPIKTAININVDDFRFYKVNNMKNIELLGIDFVGSKVTYTAHKNFTKVFAVIK